MKISEAQSIYRAYRQELVNQTRTLIKQRDEAQKKFETTGLAQFSEQAATLQLSLEATREKFDENQKVLDDLAEQHAAIWNAEVSKQQADAMQDMGIELSKIMTVARRMSNGDEVPYTDEKKLLEYSSELYQAAKSAQMIHQMEEHEKYDSLWGEEEEPEEYDPQGKADNAEVQIALPDIPTQVFVDDSVEASETTM